MVTTVSMPTLRYRHGPPAARHRDRVGDKLLRAEPLLDVREVALGRLREAGALAAHVGRLAEPERRQAVRGGASRLLSRRA